MHIQIEPITLNLETPFRIAHGTSMARLNVLVRISDGEHEGLGEAAPVRQHHETQAGVMDYLGSQSARAAIDIALHDLLGKRLGIPLYRLLSLNPESSPPTSMTISIGTAEEVQGWARDAVEHFSILKLKLGQHHSLEIVSAVRAVTDARLVAEANCAWTVEQALSLIPALADLGLEWIEQPLPEGDLDGLRQIREVSPLPIFADEPVRTAPDIPRLAGCVDGVNIKVMKSGALREALRMIAVVRAHGLQVMLGSMLETSVGITAAAHLAPLVDWADLDGNQTVTNDPFTGVLVDKGRLVLPDGPGLGVRPRLGASAPG